MEANELRIGNIVLWDSIVYPPNFILASPTRLDWFPEKKLFDIPECVPFAGVYLTEEWLVAFGFEKSKSFDDEYKGFLFEKGDFGGFYLTTNGLRPKPYYFSDAFSEDLKIIYVHQLQNIYYALTGRELSLAAAPPCP